MKRLLVMASLFVSFTLFCGVAATWMYSALDPKVSVLRTFHGVALVPNNHHVLDPPGGGPELLESNLPFVRNQSRGGFALLGFEYLAGGTPNAPIGGLEKFWLVRIP